MQCACRPAAVQSAAPLCCLAIFKEHAMDLDSKGLATRRAVLGDAYVDAALGKATPFSAPLQELVTRHAWGNTWQRQGIDLRTRSIVTVSMLVALGRMHELKVHVRGALNNGVTPEELQEIFLHASVYCGFPAAVDAFRAAAEVVDGA
jgi:4-carboxymuconolactone decarboxylase